MAHITLPEGFPGITGPMAAYPEVRQPMNDLANAVMVGASSLSQGERELIATFVSARNECRFCMNSHAAAARHLLGEESHLVEGVIRDLDTAQVSEKMRALLEIAEKVRLDGRTVTPADVQRARDAGADDRAIHDTVLITGMFGMFNRYVDGLATVLPLTEDYYEESGARIATKGYGTRAYDQPFETRV